MPGDIKKRSDFGELESKLNKRFDYAWLPEYKLPDFARAPVGSIQKVVLLNKSTQEKELIVFRVSHNMFFPYTGQRHLYGMVNTNDGRYVQIEFSLSLEGGIYDDNYNTIVAYLRTPPVHKFSLGV